MVCKLSGAPQAAVIDPCNAAMTLQLAGQLDRTPHGYGAVLAAILGQAAANHCLGMLRGAAGRV